jgi:MFS transporter, ACS family, tartrate transporter
MEATIERQTMKKVYLRLLPFCFVLYFICYLDRVNIGFAALTMNKDIGLSAYVFGLGAGAFFWGYFLLEVPSNLILEKNRGASLDRSHHDQLGLGLGCLRVHPGPDQLYYPAVQPGSRRGRVFPRHDPLFQLLVPAAAPIADRSRLHGRDSGIDRFGAPVSTAFLELDGVFGLAGWRWLFLGEAAPAVIFGVICFFYLTDRPTNAKWLTAEEKGWLGAEMQREKQTVVQHRTFSVLQTLINWRVLALAAIHFGQAGVSVGLAVLSPRSSRASA